jgi:hypothetical protein
MLSPAQVEDVRLAVYAAFAETGRAPELTKISAVTGLPLAPITAALRLLHERRDLVLDDDYNIVMAHPFAAIPLGFSVMGERALWWGGCAWDSFAIAHVLPDEAGVLVATTCPACATAHAFDVNRDAPPSGDQVAHFLTPMAKVWSDVVHACAHQRIFCSDGCVHEWLLRTGNLRGYVMDLGTLWRLARGWYAGRLDRGYQRREPIEAASYFASVGLAGPFWGLPQSVSDSVAAAG